MPSIGPVTPSSDSWSSDPDGDPSTAAVAYSAGVRGSNLTVGAVSATNSAMNLANGSVYGSVATGGGTVSGSPTISGTTSYDFSASFPTITAPTPTTFNTVLPGSNSSSKIFPSAAVGQLINASDNTYYYVFGNGVGIGLNGGNRNIQIAAGQKVVFLLNNHTGVTAISMGGNAYMNVNTGAALKIFTNGNLSMAGNGVVNGNIEPSSCLIYSTRATVGQTIVVSGNGQLRAAVYAPNAAVTANGGGASGQIQGSIVTNSITMNGGPDFHYDEALGNLSAGAGVGVSQWRELQTAAERALYTSQLNF
jgi:hypothetical protein